MSEVFANKLGDSACAVAHRETDGETNSLSVMKALYKRCEEAELLAFAAVRNVLSRVGASFGVSERDVSRAALEIVEKLKNNTDYEKMRELRALAEEGKEDE